MACIDCHYCNIAYSKKLGKSVCRNCGSTNLAWDEEFGEQNEGEKIDVDKPFKKEDNGKCKRKKE